MRYEPAIKWSGSKRKMAAEIVARFPRYIDTYYEPFLGGASVLRRVLDSDIIVRSYVCSDINDGLIALWNAIKETPNAMADHYERLWNELNVDNDLERKKSYFSSVRARFNEKGDYYHNPGDFLFIMRTCTNGMPRYNADGMFNNSLHVTRNGIEPSKLRKILSEWSELLNERNVEFRCQSYESVVSSGNDFMFLDPPYAATKGMYFVGFDVNKFFDWMRGVKCGYALTFDGKAGDEDHTYKVPFWLYDDHVYVLSGNSSFRRILGKSRDTIVYESLYTKGCGK